MKSNRKFFKVIVRISALLIVIFLFNSSSLKTFAATDTTPPTQPSQLIAIPVSSSRVSLSWMASSDVADVTGYNIYENGSQIATSTSNSYYVTGLNGSTTYSFAVSAYDAAGNTSAQSNIVSTTTTSVLPPSSPTLTATATSSSQVNLSWTASIGDGGATISGYDIYQNGIKIDTTSNTFYSINALSASTSYYFSVVARDSLGNVSQQSSLSVANVVTLGATDSTLPSTPSDLAIIGSVSSSQINLTWTASSDNVGVVGYYVYANGSQIAKTSNTYYGAVNLSSSTLYTFDVAAYDAAGNTSGLSNSVSATTTQSLVPTPDTTNVSTQTIPIPAQTTTVTTPTPTPASTLIVNPAMSNSSSNTVSIPGCEGSNLFSVTTGQPCPAGSQASVLTTTFKFSQLMKQGSAGNEVIELQNFLNNIGYSVGVVDGQFGLKTKTALIGFQTANNLTGDGIAGPMTLSTINNYKI